ncbi:MAG: A/G-specific adenine glycosylase [Actinomycetota bacterium]|nr:A/G-specific adenine glycosylase [Actinomycetota bacterium]
MREPYQILVCESMAQQTQASRVAVAFDAWIERFPTVKSLATATRGDVLRAWQGLGYNRRAIALHEAARAIVADHGGVVPGDVDTLLTLPGVGPYTAAAVASIAFGVPVVAMDTNIRRVAARVLHGAEPDELGAAPLREDAQAWLDTRDPGAWNQAVMDVGASLCRPRSPRCAACPLHDLCRFRAAGRTGRSSVRPQPAFEGSVRQLRGAVVRLLSTDGPCSPDQVAQRTDVTAERLDPVLRALVGEGLIERTAAGSLQLSP